MKFLYSFFIWIYPRAIRIAGLFNRKALLWIEGRKNIFQQIQKAIGTPGDIVWFHCSSLGEFEQARTVIENINTQFPRYKILVTFFSPSGYEVRKHYEKADFVFYLPMDGKKNAEQFFNIVQPKLVVFVKYEFWYYYLKIANERSIPLILISSIFRKSQPFFNWYGNFYRKMLFFFTHIFVQNQESLSLLNGIGIPHASIAGDTRFDRVAEISGHFERNKLIEKFIENSKVIVAGSTWLEDDKELAHYTNSSPHVKFIIAPHHTDKDRISECLQLYKNSILYSDLEKCPLPLKSHTLIINNVGMLSQIYKYGTIAYVGGGFGGDGVHNVLEPAVYGIPVVLGPTYEKYAEAVALVENGGAISVRTTLALENTFNELLKTDEDYKSRGDAAVRYVQNNVGATKRIIELIYEKRLLTN